MKIIKKYKRKRKTKSKLKWKKYVFYFFIFVFVVGMFSAIPALSSVRVLRDLRSHVKPIKDSLLLQDIDMLKNELTEVNNLLGKLDSSLNKIAFYKAIPIASWYYNDVKNVVVASRSGINAAVIGIEAIRPFADVLGFKTSETIASLNVEEKIAGLIKAMPAINDRLDDISPELHKARISLDKINPKRYPKSLFGKPVRSYLTKARDTIDGVDTSLPDISDLLTSLPGVLGGDSPRTYLIIFQNDKELRATGGFWTAYALITINDGRISDIRQGDMYDVDARIATHPAPPSIIAKFLRLDKWYARDANLSPDFVISSQKFEEFWARDSASVRIDGIIALDTQFVSGMLEVLGEVKVGGYSETFTSENVAQVLETYSTIVFKEQEGRKALIGDLMSALISKAYSAPQKEWPQIIFGAYNLAVEKHLLLYLHDGAAQALAERRNFAGRVVDYEYDYLHVNDTNLGGRKANIWIVETIMKEVKKKGKKLLSTVTIHYENTGEYHSEWNTGYRDYVRIYVPKGSKLIGSSGSEIDIEVSEDLGKTVFAGYMAVNPLESATLVLEYELPEGMLDRKDYKLLVQKQPGTDGHSFELKVGRKSKKLELNTDKELSLRL